MWLLFQQAALALFCAFSFLCAELRG